jgi:hypothetical protein
LIRFGQVGEAPVSSCHLFVSHHHTGIIHVVLAVYWYEECSSQGKVG